VRAATVDSSTDRDPRMSRSTNPAANPSCENLGVVSGGRNVDMVAFVIFRGK
jgi:hypothetical protein